MSHTAHPYRKQLPLGLDNPQVPNDYIASSQNSYPSAQAKSAPYPSRRINTEPSTGSATSNNTYQSAQSNTRTNGLDTSTINSYETPNQGSAHSPPPGSSVSQRTSTMHNGNALGHSTVFQSPVIQPPAPPHATLASMTGSSESLPLPPPVVIGGSHGHSRNSSHCDSRNASRHGSDPSSPRLQPPDTPIGARSFSLPPQIHEDFNKSHQTSTSESPASPASFATDLQANYNAKSHARQSKSVDLSHMYLLDRSESTHFTLTNESMSDVSQNLIRQYLGENSSSSLLPRMKTIELYRKNVKKSNDPKVLFQYAQYMLQTALTMDHKQENDPEGGATLEKNIKKQFLKEAVHYLKKLSDKGYTDAQYLLADAYSSGALGKVENKEAFSLFQGAAKHGHVESAYRTAYSYEEGLGTTRDSRRAIEFLKYAASKNHPAAMYKLGVYSFYGRMGLPDNVNVKKSGIQWLSRAVTKANELTNAAPYELAKIYDEGFLDIVIPDHKYAMELYVQAASLGHVKSAAILGKTYEIGDDVVPQDADLSIHYYTQAAVAGDPESMLALCAWYLLGNPPNLEKDNFEAFQWAIRAAKLSYPKAQSTVGHFFEKGIGCDASLDSAKYWYTKAMEHGDDRAKTKLMKLNNQSSSSCPSPQLVASSGDSSILRSVPSTTSLTLNSTAAVTPPHMKKETKKDKKSKKDKKDKDKDCVIM